MPPRRVDAGTGLTKAPVIRSYQVGRYTDPVDPRVLHEAHTVYRIEEDGDWVLDPDAEKPAAVVAKPVTRGAREIPVETAGAADKPGIAQAR